MKGQSRFYAKRRHCRTNPGGALSSLWKVKKRDRLDAGLSTQLHAAVSDDLTRSYLVGSTVTVAARSIATLSAARLRLVDLQHASA